MAGIRALLGGRRRRRRHHTEGGAVVADPPVERFGVTDRRVFLDPELEQRFRADGFLHLPLLDADRVAALRERFEEIYVGNRANECHRSNESTDLDYRRSLHRLIVDVIGAPGSEWFDDHVVFSTGALVKWRGPDSAMPVHQDWTVVDEERFRSISIWVPLCDVDRTNGALAVVPGSHRVLSPMRMSPDPPPWYDDPVRRIDPASMQVVEMRAGECLVFDHALLHYSPPNEIDDPRIALVAAFVPAEAEFVHFWRDPDERIGRYAVRDSEFFRRFSPGMVPEGPDVRFVEHVEYAGHAPGAADWLAGRVRLDEP